MSPCIGAAVAPHNGLELSCPAEAGNSPLLYGTPAGNSSIPESAARRVSFSELLGIQKSLVASRPSRICWDPAKYAKAHQIADVALGSVERQEAQEIIEPFVLLTE